MARYIDADALEADFIKIGLIVQCSDSSRAAAYHVNRAPTVDVAPVVHGQWIEKISGNGWNEWANLKCSLCGEKYEKIDCPSKYNYCPNCGAKMERVKRC